MEKYVFDLQSSDKFLFDQETVVIDRFVPMSDDEIGIDGYFEQSGDGFFQVFDYNDSVQIVR